MFANKNKKLAVALLGLIFLVQGITMIFPSTARADSGQDFLQFMGCDDKNGDGSLNFFDDCTSGGSTPGQVTSFITFKGDLTPPNTEGYAAGLTQATDARTFILRVTNFALGFLGLIAVLIVIYGGFLSVISAGDAEKAKKGRSAITYAAIGLLLVMGSFALVNTILLAPGGKGETSGAQSALNNSTIRGVAGAQRFNYLASQIEDIMVQVYKSYQFHLSAKQQLENGQAAINSYNESSCVVPMSSCVSAFRTLTTSQVIILRNLVNLPDANVKFNTNMTKLINDINTLINNGGDGAKSLSAIAAYSLAEGCDDSENTFADTNPCKDSQKQKIINDINVLKGAITAKIAGAGAFLSESYKIDLDSAAQKTAAVYQTVKGLASNMIGQKYFTDLIKVFVGNQSATDVTTAFAGSAYEAEWKSMTPFLKIDGINNSASLSTLGQDNIKLILKSLMEIRSLLTNLQFVNAIVSADVVQGNAPLIVNFSSVGSTDPSGFTITDSQIKWDLNGDGVFSGDNGALSATSGSKEEGYMNCPENLKATASCIFTKAGTYRVTLKIKPKSDPKALDPATGLSWEQEVAPGISYIDVLVNPPATKINLEVGPKSGPMRTIIKYSETTGTIQEDHDKIYFTLAEAKAGLKFDATKSTFSDGSTSINGDINTKVRWNFGVPSPNNDIYQVASDGSLAPLEQAYSAVGSYQVRFEVMDKNGVIDRKIFTVVISNVAPRITNPPVSGEVNKEIIFDGSNSTSSGGPMIFNWSIEKIPVGQLTAYIRSSDNWVARSAHAALVDPNKTLSEAGAVSAAASQVLPVKTLEPSKRSESNSYYDCSMPEGKDDTLKCNFKKAGTYKVTLYLDDDGEAQDESTIITINSTSPTASFRATRITDASPALYRLDGSNFSFDPDEKDNSNLEYSWEFNPNNCVLVGFADENTEADLTNAYSAQTPCESLKPFSAKSGQPVVKFTQKGNFTVSLVVRMIDEPNLISESYEQTLVIDNILDVTWGEMKPSNVLQVTGGVAGADQLPSEVNTTPVAPITFIFNSSQAISYDLDFGDGINESGEMSMEIPKEVVHQYTATGKYTAKLSVFDADDVENSISRKIFIGDGKSPVSIVTTLVDGSEVEPQDLEMEDGKTLENVVVVNRKNNLTFDAVKSLNTDGTSRRLKYSWNINNNEKQSTNKQIAYNFSQISENGQPYPVKLKVTNEKDATQVSEDSVNILVVGEQPTLRSLTAVPDGLEQTTPVNVKLTAVGAQDTDGQIVQYKWWYYPANNPPSSDERLGLQITAVPTAVLTIGTRGIEGEKPTYKFGVEMTDNDNLTVSTDSQNDDQKLNLIAPQVQVTNGPNKAPVARFTVDRTSVQVGEMVNYASSSFDPDTGGGIKEYKWDFGDGSKGENKASVSHAYQKANVDGYKVKLTVVDSNSSEATSDPVKIYVDAQAEPPVASFTSQQQSGAKTVKFTNTSTADEAAGAAIKKYSWDFDVSLDSNGDGKKDNDIDSGESNPTYTYPNYGIYRAKLTVEDNQGQVRSITNFVNVKPAVPATVSSTGGGVRIAQGEFDSAVKSAGANLFEASHKVDTGLLAGSVGAYAILWLISQRKQKATTKNK